MAAKFVYPAAMNVITLEVSDGLKSKRWVNIAAGTCEMNISWVTMQFSSHNNHFQSEDDSPVKFMEVMPGVHTNTARTASESVVQC